MLIETSIGEVIDKLSILLIKKNKIKDNDKLKFVLDEIKTIENSLISLDIEDYVNELNEVNLKLWEINDKRKEMISQKIFNEEYLQLTIQESSINDQRFLIKKKINESLNSNIKEQKSYNWL